MELTNHFELGHENSFVQSLDYTKEKLGRIRCCRSLEFKNGQTLRIYCKHCMVLLCKQHWPLMKTFGIPSNSPIIPIMNFQASQMRLPEYRSVCGCVCGLAVVSAAMQHWKTGERVEQSISVFCFNQQIRWQSLLTGCACCTCWLVINWQLSLFESSSVKWGYKRGPDVMPGEAE